MLVSVKGANSKKPRLERPEDWNVPALPEAPPPRQGERGADRRLPSGSACPNRACGSNACVPDQTVEVDQ